MQTKKQLKEELLVVRKEKIKELDTLCEKRQKEDAMWSLTRLILIDVLEADMGSSNSRQLFSLLQKTLSDIPGDDSNTTPEEDEELDEWTKDK